MSGEAMTSRPPRRSLILAGGGYKVAFQAGVLQVWLDEAGIEFDHADGASGGNLNLAMWCQGMSGTQIADNWRNLPPRLGIGFNWRQWPKLIYADSLLTLDRFRRNVLVQWGFDWQRIRATRRDATFNVYDFTAHELVPLPASQLDPEMLMASISIPMWFPAVQRAGRTYLDAVFLTDANLEEAIARGADELWIIWTVSEQSRWRAGFVGAYFGIIETVANGNFRRSLRRIEANNREVAAGRPGEFGRHVEVRILRAEVPIHYLVILGSDRVRHCVERGVAEARRWCREQGIELRPQGSLVGPPDRTGLTFSETMKGHVGLGQADYRAGWEAGRRAGKRLAVHLDVSIAGMRRFVAEPEHQGSIRGVVECAALGGRLPLERGTLNLFVDRGDPGRKEMRYRLLARDGAGQPLTIVGHKSVHDDPGFDLWTDTSTLYTRVLRGHIEREEDEARAEVLAAGIIRVHPLDFLRQLTTMRAHGPSTAERAGVVARFGSFFFGRLWDVYGQGVLTSAPF
ncbi:MAG TPA: patatin-like phospholipase family protein [Candidatus Limnocylindria bacterium]|nr:patatin-like phospholipase family protein [Candidatus Limnocylindria bacterium]